MKNAVAHFEIYADDPGKLAQFYTTLFDWTIEPFPGMDYRVVKTIETDKKGMATKPGGINGGLVPREKPARTGWINYVTVDSVDAALNRARELGAKVTRERSA